MGGHKAVPRTRFSRVPCDDPGVAVFRISGSLGPRAKPQLVRLTQECLRRNLPRVVLDLSEIDALGGGTARLLNEFAAERAGRGGKTAFRVTSRTVRGFLCADATMPPPALTATLEEAVAAVRNPGPMLFAAEEPVHRPRASVQLVDGTPSTAGRVASSRVDFTDADFFPGPEPHGPIALAPDFEPDSEVEEIEPRAAAAWTGLHRAATLESLRDRLVAALHERGIASRVFLFKHVPPGEYQLATRQGLDRERTLPANGALMRHVGALVSPGFVVDLDHEKLGDAEAELVAELNCEVVAPVWSESRVEFVVFMSKERPGDEYTLEELQELDAVLRTLGETQVPRQTPLPASQRRPASEATPRRETRRATIVELAPARGPSEARELKRSLAQLRDIVSLSQDFDAAFGTSRLLDVLLLSVVSVTRVATVLYFASRDSEYRLTHHRGLSPDAIQGLRLRADTTLVQATLASPRGVCIAETLQITEEERIWARQHGLCHAVPFRFKDEVLGVLLLGEGAQESPPDLETLAWLLAQAGLAYDRARLYEMLQDRTLGVVRGLITLIEARNGFDCGSTEQVVRYTQALARELKFPSESLRDLVYGAVLRDVGMLKVSEALLRSAQDLTSDQWEAIRRHPQEGASIMRQMRFEDVAIDVVLHHHESYNGDGYPMGLRGRAIPLGARIVAVAESYVKMTMDRPYRKALGKADALESLAENWGLRYDPLVVDALVRVVNRELSLGLKGDLDLTHDLFGV